MRYIARIIFRIQAGGSIHSFDEQLRMIEAENRQDAGTIARLTGEQEEGLIESAGGEKIRWEFIGVSGLWELHENRNGALVYSFTNYGEKEEEDYINFVRAVHRDICGAVSEKPKPLPLEQQLNFTAGTDAG